MISVFFKKLAPMNKPEIVVYQIVAYQIRMLLLYINRVSGGHSHVSLLHALGQCL